MEIYIDVIFVVNTVINYLILLVTAKICDISANRGKVVLAAMLGGLYSAAAVVYGLGYGFLESTPIKLISGIFMLMTAYGNEKNLLKITAVFFSASATFAGSVLAVSYMSGKNSADWIYRPISLKLLLLSFALSYIAISFVYRRAGRNLTGGGVFEVSAEIGESTAKFMALHDTGNSLSEPFSGDHVIVTDLSTAKPLLSPEIEAAITDDLLRKPIQAVQQLYEKDKRYKFRLIPYRAIGVNSGFLIALKPDKVYINHKLRRDMLIALSPNKISSGEGYSALIGGEKI